MESAAKAWNLAVAWDHLAAAAHYLARAAQGSPLAAGAPPRRPPLPLPPRLHGHLHRRPYHHHGSDDLELGGAEMGFDDDDGAEKGFALELPRGRHGRHLPSPDLDDDDDGGGGGEDDEDADDDFAFGIVDLFDLTYAVGVCIPPYPIYKNTSSYRDLHADAWTWLTLLYSLVFSVRVFRSSRRLLPTALRALVLALSISAQVSAAAHFLPSSTLATGVSYASIFLHIFVYMLAWCACCSARCRQMVCCL